MKQITMPKQGTLFTEDKKQRLDYVVNGTFVDVKLLSSSEIIQYPGYMHIIYHVIYKCIFNHNQFEKYLFNEQWINEPVEISFDDFNNSIKH